MRDEFEWRGLCWKLEVFFGGVLFFGLGNNWTFWKKWCTTTDILIVGVYIYIHYCFRHWQWKQIDTSVQQVSHGTHIIYMYPLGSFRERVHAPPSKTVNHSAWWYYTYTLCICFHHNEPFHQTWTPCATSPHLPLHAIVVLSCQVQHSRQGHPTPIGFRNCWNH